MIIVQGCQITQHHRHIWMLRPDTALQPAQGAAK
jgi:hypothetical protein